jgi:hypothetical protein
LDYEPEDDEDRKEIFELKRQTVLNLVEKAIIKRDREIQVWFRFDVMNFLRGEFGEIKNNGTFAPQRCGDVR